MAAAMGKHNLTLGNISTACGHTVTKIEMILCQYDFMMVLLQVGGFLRQ